MKLTKPQRTFLSDLAEHDALAGEEGNREEWEVFACELPTARALEKKGLVAINSDGIAPMAALNYHMLKLYGISL